MKTLLFVALMLSASLTFAQTVKPKTKTTNIKHADVVNIGNTPPAKDVVKEPIRKVKKDTMEIVYVVKESDYINLIQMSQAWKGAVPFVPGIKEVDKPQVERTITQFLIGLDQRSKLDSIKVKK